jgi:hypothetical protein
VNIPAVKYFCEKIGNTANDGNEYYEPDPVILLAFTNAMNYTNNLQYNCNYVKITAPRKKIIHSGGSGCPQKYKLNRFSSGFFTPNI